MKFIPTLSRLLCTALGGVLLFVSGACDDRTSRQQSGIYDQAIEVAIQDQTRIWDEQNAEWLRQTEKVKAQEVRYDELIKKWEEQAVRYDALLQQWENQAKQTDKLFEAITSALESLNKRLEDARK